MGTIAITVEAIYPEDMETLERLAADVMARIILNRLSPKSVDELIRRLEEKVAKEEAEKITKVKR